MRDMNRKSVFIFEFVPESYEGPIFDWYFLHMIGKQYVSRSRCFRFESSEDLEGFFRVGGYMRTLKNSQFIHISSHGGYEPDKRAGSEGYIECSKCGKPFDEVRLVDERQIDENFGLICPKCAGLGLSYVKRRERKELRRRRSVRSLIFPGGLVHWRDFPMGCFEGKTVTLSACLMGDNVTISEYNDQRWNAGYVIAPKYEVRFDDSLLWYLNFYYLVLRHGYSTQQAFSQCNKFLSSKVSKEVGISKGRKSGKLGGFRLFDFPDWR